MSNKVETLVEGYQCIPPKIFQAHLHSEVCERKCDLQPRPQCFSSVQIQKQLSSQNTGTCSQNYLCVDLDASWPSSSCWKIHLPVQVLTLWQRQPWFGLKKKFWGADHFAMYVFERKMLFCKKEAHMNFVFWEERYVGWKKNPVIVIFTTFQGCQ